MKKLKVGYVMDGEGSKFPVLFSNASLLYWQKNTGGDLDVLLGGEEESPPFDQMWLFYAGLVHGYGQLGLNLKYTFDDFAESIQTDETFVENFVKEFQEQMFAKAEALGFDVDRDALEGVDEKKVVPSKEAAKTASSSKPAPKKGASKVKSSKAAVA